LIFVFAEFDRTHDENVVSETEEATRAIAGFATAPRGLVRMTTPPGFGGAHLPQLISKLAARHAEVTFEVKLTNQIIDLVADGFDLAIRGGVLPDSSLVARKFAGSALGLFTSPEYLERPRPAAQPGRPDAA
jgi:DNA-binding transcriptional LysR family regulator